MSKKRNSLSVLDQVILYAGLLMVAALIAVIVLAICLHCKAGAINVLTVIAAALSGILLGLTIFYQIRQFYLSRFRAIFQHQMELHAQFCEKVVYAKRYRHKTGSEAIRELAEYLTGELEKTVSLQGNRKLSVIELFNNVDFDVVLNKTFNGCEHYFTPYFRHITSVLDFLSHRAPKEERRDYPRHYLNIFSKCELRLYLYYVIYEVNRIAERTGSQIRWVGEKGKSRVRNGHYETDLFQLLFDVDYLRYIRATLPKDDVLEKYFHGDYRLAIGELAIVKSRTR